MVTLSPESVCLSAGSNLELSMVHKDFQVHIQKHFIVHAGLL